MIPTNKFLALLLPPVVGLVILPLDVMVFATIAYNLSLVALAMLDLAVSPSPAQFRIERRAPRNLSLGADNTIGWVLSNASEHTVAFALTEDVPTEIHRDKSRMEGRILGRSKAEVLYNVRPGKRGLFELGDISLRYWTRLGLLIRQVRIPAKTPVKIYPNVASLARYELAAQRHRLAELGLVSTRRRGQGTNFESLRDYVPGDDLASVDWKATARHHRMITRNYEAERSQNILIVLDCGRLMVTQVDELSRLDHAINASILLTYVAMKQGDYIGLLAFSDQIESYVPPVRGLQALPRMNDALYKLEARLKEPNYDEACKYLSLRYRKRSLIIILTDVIDKDASSALLAYTARFARRHQTLCVTLRNREVERLASQAPAVPLDCHTKAVALQILHHRAEAIERMRRSGADVLDVDPRVLTPNLVHRYLEMKRK